MADVVIYIPGDSESSEWKKADDLPGEVQAKLRQYRLCQMDWENEKHNSVKCDTNKNCEGKDCVFWVVVFNETDIIVDGVKHHLIQDLNDPQTFGQADPDSPSPPRKSIKFGDGGADLVQERSSRVLFCSCGTLEEIDKLKKKHAWVKAPQGDPPK